MQTIHSRRRTLALAVAAALTTGAAQAQEGGSQQDFTLDQLTITGGPERISNVPGSAHVIDEEALDRHNYGDPIRVLRQIPGVNMRQEDGFGLFPNIGMRGTATGRSSKITLMEDGILAAPAPYAAPSAYYFPPVGRMHNVEVRKGSSAIQYGPYTNGGALNMISTPIPSEEFSGRIQSMLGSDGGERHHAHIGGSEGQWGWMIEGYTDGSDGFRDLDTPRDVQGERSENLSEQDTGFERREFVGKLRWHSAPGAEYYQQVDLKVGMGERDANESYMGQTLSDFRKDPYRRYAASAQDRFHSEREQYSLTHYIEFSEDLDLSTTLYRNNFERNWYKLGNVEGTSHSEIITNPDDNQNLLNWLKGTPATSDAYQGQSNRGLIANVDAGNRKYYSQGIQTELGYRFETGDIKHDLDVGLRVHEDEIDRHEWDDEYAMTETGSMVFTGTSGGPRTGSNRKTEADAIAGYVLNTMSFGRWQVMPGVRYESIDLERTEFGDVARSTVTGGRENSYDVVTPGIGATYQVSNALTLLGGVHRGFSPAGSKPDAEEETSINYELGARYNQGAFSSELIAFYNDYDNLLAECSLSSGCNSQQVQNGETFNGGEVEIQGLEATALYDLGADQQLGLNLPLSVTYTYTESEFTSNNIDREFASWGDAQKGDELPDIPEHQLTVSAGIETGPWSGDVTGNYVSDARSEAGSGAIPADETIESRFLVDVSGRYAFTEQVSGIVSVENATDEEYISSWNPAGARPGMPRTYWAGVEVNF
ncbi:TonB-dependent receptor [Halospina sp. K52047b]|uniref:TonB-dependent receptor family protein n=1 Tax=Halospina sp. K52047b TaxID=2614160 RepID=UPI00124A20F5|nr:TonB-dependent receptor [Halospina sp. K52047b]KAA8982500.1 TonB-dependent receptor [Halospina sp. K52047b]